MVTVQVPGAEPTIVNHTPCDRHETASNAAVYNTPVPDRNAYVVTWVSWEFGCGESAVYRLGEQRCEHCGHEFWTPRTGSLPLWSRDYRSANVTRGGLLEAHMALVSRVVANAL